MFKRGAAPGTGRSLVASRIPWLRSGEGWTSREVAGAARADGTPWDRSTCAAAARGGHLDALQWARANGCP